MASSGIWIPGAERLRRRVVASCGPVSQLDVLGHHRFGDWIANGRQAPRATVAAVEPYLAGYLERAGRVGRRWGALAGIMTGTVLGALIVVVAWAWSVLG